jgi:hypothetical protein
MEQITREKSNIQIGYVRKEVLKKLDLSEKQVTKCTFIKPKSDKGL